MTKNLCQFKKYGSRRTETKFWKINCKRKELDTFLKRFGKHEAPTIGTRAADQSTRVLKRKWPLWMNWWAYIILNQDGQKLRSTRQISRETGRFLRHSVASYWSFTVILVWSVFRLPTRILLFFFQFFYIYISQGSVATLLRCGGIFTNHFIANSPVSVTVKELWISVTIWQRCGQYTKWKVFLRHSVDTQRRLSKACVVTKWEIKIIKMKQTKRCTRDHV